MCPPAAESNFGLSERPQFWGGVVRVTIRRHNFVHSSFVGIRKCETVTTSKHMSTADSINAYPAPSRHTLNQNTYSFERQYPSLRFSPVHGEFHVRRAKCNTGHLWENTYTMWSCWRTIHLDQTCVFRCFCRSRRKYLF